MICGPEEIDSFTHRYGIPGFFGSPMINWPAVAIEYQGVIVAPYSWERRNSWYYPWDCASGCIWDAAAIESITVDQEWKGLQDAA